MVKNSIVKENKEKKKGAKTCEGCCDITLLGWFWMSAAQKSTEAKIIGILKNAIMPTIAQINAIFVYIYQYYAK